MGSPRAVGLDDGPRARVPHRAAAELLAVAPALRGARVRASARELVRFGRECARCEAWSWLDLQALCRAEIGACRFCRAERVNGLGQLCEYHNAVVWDALTLWRRCNVRRDARCAGG